MSKNDLIGILRDYEHNYATLYSFYKNSVKNAEALLKEAEGITLAALLSAFEPKTGVFIVHYMGAEVSEVSEGVGGGMAAELLASDVVKKVGGNVVKRIAVDLDDWPDTPTPTVIVTIGNKRR